MERPSSDRWFVIDKVVLLAKAVLAAWEYRQRLLSAFFYAPKHHRTIRFVDLGAMLLGQKHGF